MMFVFFNDTATTEIYTLSLHDALPIFARGKFRDIRWMTATPNGTVYLIDAVDLVQVTPNGAIRTVARNLSASRLIRPDIGDHHLLMGLWTDPRGNVCVADYAHGEVKQVDVRGRVSVIA